MNWSVHSSEMFVGLNASCEHIMAVSRVSFVPRGVWRGAFDLVETVQMGLVPVHVYDVYDVYDDVLWVSYKDMSETFDPC